MNVEMIAIFLNIPESIKLVVILLLSAFGWDSERKSNVPYQSMSFYILFICMYLPTILQKVSATTLVLSLLASSWELALFSGSCLLQLSVSSSAAFLHTFFFQVCRLCYKSRFFLGKSVL